MVLRAHLPRRHLLVYVSVVLGFVCCDPCVSLPRAAGDRAVGEQDVAVEMPSLDPSSYYDPHAESTTTVGEATASIPCEHNRNGANCVCRQGEDELQGSCQTRSDGHSAITPDGSTDLNAVAGETRGTGEVKEMEELSRARTHYPASAESTVKPVHPEPIDSPESAASESSTHGGAEVHRTGAEPQEEDTEGLECTQIEGPSSKDSATEHPRVIPRPTLKPAARGSPPYGNPVLDAKDELTRPASQQESDSVPSRDRYPSGRGQDHPAGRLVNAGIAAKGSPNPTRIPGRHDRVSRAEDVVAGSGLEDFAREIARVPSGEEAVCHWSDGPTGLDLPGPSPGVAQALKAVSMASAWDAEEDEQAQSEEKRLSWRSQAIVVAVCVILFSLAYAKDRLPDFINSLGASTREHWASPLDRALAHARSRSGSFVDNRVQPLAPEVDRSEIPDLIFLEEDKDSGGEAREDENAIWDTRPKRDDRLVFDNVFGVIPAGLQRAWAPRAEPNGGLDRGRDARQLPPVRYTRAWLNRARGLVEEPRDRETLGEPLVNGPTSVASPRAKGSGGLDPADAAGGSRLGDSGREHPEYSASDEPLANGLENGEDEGESREDRSGGGSGTDEMEKAWTGSGTSRLDPRAGEARGGGDEIRTDGAERGVDDRGTEGRPRVNGAKQKKLRSGGGNPEEACVDEIGQGQSRSDRSGVGGQDDGVEKKSDAHRAEGRVYGEGTIENSRGEGAQQQGHVNGDGGGDGDVFREHGIREGSHDDDADREPCTGVAEEGGAGGNSEGLRGRGDGDGRAANVTREEAQAGSTARGSRRHGARWDSCAYGGAGEELHMDGGWDEPGVSATAGTLHADGTVDLSADGERRDGVEDSSGEHPDYEQEANRSASDFAGQDPGETHESIPNLELRLNPRDATQRS